MSQVACTRCEHMSASRTHPKAVGDATQAMVLGRLVQAGKTVLVPFGENLRYDLLLDESGAFVRVQCKTGRLRDGAVWFPTCSSTYHYPNNQGVRYCQVPYTGQADVFGVYCPELDRVYVVPVCDVPLKSAALRVDPARNNQTKGVRFARDYELSTSCPDRGRRAGGGD